MRVFLLNETTHSCGCVTVFSEDCFQSCGSTLLDVDVVTIMCCAVLTGVVVVIDETSLVEFRLLCPTLSQRYEYWLSGLIIIITIIINGDGVSRQKASCRPCKLFGS